MSDEPTHDISDALNQAREQLDAMRVAASEADAADGLSGGGMMHAVEGVGRYGVPYQDGWGGLLDLLRDGSAKLGFSENEFPSFDKIVAAKAQAPALRENLAALRNYLMQGYYSDTPAGMTPEKAKQSLEEIAGYLGDALEAKRLDAERASAPEGKGTQYLFEQIHGLSRRVGWLRPYPGIAALFKLPLDWALPKTWQTPFHNWLDGLFSFDQEMSEGEVDAAMQELDALELKREKIEEEMRIVDTMTDLEKLGDNLIRSAQSLPDVSTMSEPVRRDAIELAKEILRKLRNVMGDKDPTKGLGINPEDDVAPLGGLIGVAEVYERLLGWARGVDPTIMQHPAIMAAIQALGKLGYISKFEAFRMALLSSDAALADRLQADLDGIPAGYADMDELVFATLIDRVEAGIDTVLNRVQSISGPGASVGHSPGKELGSFMAATPIAGNALQAKSEGVGGRDAQVRQQQAVQEARASATRAQTQRIASQVAQQQRTAQGANQPSSRGSAQAQLNAVRQRLAAARRNTSAQMAARNAQMAHMHDHDHDHDHHGPQHHNPQAQQQSQMAQTIAKIDPRLLNNIKQMNTMTAGLTNMPVVTGRQAFDKMQKAATGGLKPPATPAAPAKTDEQKKKEQQAMMPPPPPNKGGRGI